MSRSANRGATENRPATAEKVRIASGPSSRVPRIVATSPATIRGGLSRPESARQPMPTAKSAAAAIAEWRAGLGLGGRPESASTTGRRAIVRPGHQAAAVAPTSARRAAATISPQGRLSRSMRWPTADSSVGAKTSQSARPPIVPTIAAIVPTTAPLVNSTSRMCFCVAPTAASMPSWRSRRCATTAKPAAATSNARNRKTVATENIASVSAVLLTSFPRDMEPANAGRERSPWDP